jgi:putative transcriptional regulator
MAPLNTLKSTRQARGLTQEALATMVGVSRQSIMAIERGRYVPSVKLALDLARALEATVDAMSRWWSFSSCLSACPGRRRWSPAWSYWDCSRS